MWKSFCHISEPALYLKVEAKTKTPEAQSYKISVTNYVKLWAGVFDDNSIIEIMLKSNKDVETENIQGFLQKGLDMLYNPQDNDNKEFKELDNGNLSIKLICLGPIVLKMFFMLEVCTADQFFYDVTRPLLLIINDQMRSENQLRHLLFKKDNEIQGFLDTLPNNSPLMRCLRTDVYNDVKHMKEYRAMTSLWGTDSDLRISPQRILRGKPLPNNKVRAETSGTTRTSTKESSTQKTVIKVEPNSDGSPTTTNPSVQISAVKSEPNDGKSKPKISTSKPAVSSVKSEPTLLSVKSEPNDVKSEPNDGKSEPNDGKSELNDGKSEPNDGNSEPDDDASPNDGTTVSGSNDDKQPQTGAANKTSTQSSGQNADTFIQPMASGVTEQSDKLGPTPVDQDYNAQNATAIPKAEPDSQGMQNSMPKKRRKNLNY